MQRTHKNKSFNCKTKYYTLTIEGVKKLKNDINYIINFYFFTP